MPETSVFSVLEGKTLPEQEADINELYFEIEFTGGY